MNEFILNNNVPIIISTVATSITATFLYLYIPRKDNPTISRLLLGSILSISSFHFYTVHLLNENEKALIAAMENKLEQMETLNLLIEETEQLLAQTNTTLNEKNEPSSE